MKILKQRERAVIGIIFLLVIIFLAVKNVVNELSEAYSSYHWKTTTGKIIPSEVLDRYKNSDGGYVLHLKYKYTINNTTYEGDRWKLGMNGNEVQSWKRLKDILSQYRYDSSVVIFYNPENPQRSVLIRGFNLDHLIMPSVFLFFIALLFSLRTKKIKRPT